MDEFIGIIKIFGGNYAPEGYMFCNGQVLQVTQYQALFAVIGNVYGGDGRATFALPDLRGRAPIHFGQGPNLSNYALAAKGGTESVTLTISNMPSHNHPLNVNSAAANAATPTTTTVLAAVVDENGGQVNGYSTNAANTQLAPASIGAIGGNSAFENRMPYIAMNYIICINGLFPSRS